MALPPPYDPNFKLAFSLGSIAEIENHQDHDESASAAVVAVDLISSARFALKLDSVYTEYSAKYLVDNAGGSHRGRKLTVKDCLEFAINKGGIPKAEDWPRLGSVIKPPSSYKPDLVSMKGQVIEPKTMEEACDLLVHQPVGAKLHVFMPHIELQQDGIYCGTSGEPASYVGLRDAIIIGAENIQGKSIATVKVWYKKKFIFLKVAMSRWFQLYSPDDTQKGIEPTHYLVDFCVPRLSIN
ncbi:unnamed protein product [Arabidopsis lyrata]|uniref:Papain-like cysteine peptidase superfamily n=1 Tax=Arabidopsis suecica TaxID=45249 RepID=A0A8T2CYG0_ARASU|nr:protein HEAT-INDUCED TAS1 TARGET 5 [Arabidopsis lyrata subsp. lyrata]XP_020868388.1 protein HEAT-INDUCED TAS1 TARGET 5 [Arabidopsis lyrata subsp. lyrata]KAG7599781.1 Papain-like cysteine peptidase superfamily [Arabidopsis suecica]CAH8254882.1 unnamed protein product [Arabidopsis lyrata]|eukprot:XP_020868387.1 protein HEAT-INDUCED TAS1 TARGET 5 [Arabidopsis lyrata subsp. lyrata]